MQPKNSLILALAILLAAGCATGRPRGFISSSQGMQSGFGLDKVYLAPGAQFSRYPNLTVEVVNKAPTSSLGDPKTQLLIQKFQDELVARIRKTGVFQQVAKAGSGETPSLIFRVFVTALDPGSQAMRFWVGMGAGSARVEMEGEALDPSTNESLFRFADARAGDDIAGVFGSEDLMDDDLSAQAKKIAEVFAAHK